MAHPMRMRVAIRLVRGQAEYEREVLNPDTHVHIGEEKGTGSVTPDGNISLSGSAAGTGWNFVARYAGRLEATTFRLTGTQTWQLGFRPTIVRPCAIVAIRSQLD